MTTADGPPAIGAGTLAGQLAVITGGSKGIGFSIAETFLAEGASVVIAARGREALASARERLESKVHDGQWVDVIEADTGSVESVARFFDELKSRDQHRMNVFVANAGSGKVGSFLDLSVEDWDRIVALNLTGTFLCCQNAARLMRDGVSGNRVILVVSSVRATGVRPNVVAYAASKAGVNQMVRVAAYELAPLGIRVNALSPGITATSLSEVEENKPLFAKAAASVPMGRAGESSDMAAAALYLCSPQAAFVTGANLVVDGGESLW